MAAIGYPTIKTNQRDLQWPIAPDGLIPNSVIRFHLWPDDCPYPLQEKLPNIATYQSRLNDNNIITSKIRDDLLSELVSSLWFDISLEGMDLKSVIMGLFSMMDQSDESVYEHCMDGLHNIVKTYEAPKQLEAKIMKKLLKDSTSTVKWKTTKAQKAMSKLQLKSDKYVHLVQNLQDPSDNIKKAAMDMLKQETGISDLKSLMKHLKSDLKGPGSLGMTDSMRKQLITSLKTQLEEDHTKVASRKLMKIKTPKPPAASQDSILKGRIFAKKVIEDKKSDEHAPPKLPSRKGGWKKMREASMAIRSLSAITTKGQGFVAEAESRVSSASSLQLLTLQKVEESKSAQLPTITKLPALVTHSPSESGSITDIRIHRIDPVPSPEGKSFRDVIDRPESGKLGLSSKTLADRMRVPFVRKLTASSIRATLAPDNMEDWRLSLYELVNKYGKRASKPEEKPETTKYPWSKDIYKKQLHRKQLDISPGQRVLDTILQRSITNSFGDKLWHVYSLPWQQSFVTVNSRGISKFGKLGMTWSTCDFNQMSRACEWVRNSTHRIDSSIFLKR